MIQVILPQPALLLVLEVQLDMAVTLLCASMTVGVDPGLNGRLLGEGAVAGTHSNVQEDPLATQPQSQGGSPPLSPQRHSPDARETDTWKPKAQGWLACGGPQNTQRLSLLPLKIDAASKTQGKALARRLLSGSSKDEGHSAFSLLQP